MGKKKTGCLKFETSFVFLTNKSVVHSVDMKRERDSEKLPNKCFAEGRLGRKAWSLQSGTLCSGRKLAVVVSLRWTTLSLWQLLKNGGFQVYP